MERSLINNFDPRGGNGQVIGPLPLPSLGAKQKLCAIARPDPGRFDEVFDLRLVKEFQNCKPAPKL